MVKREDLLQALTLIRPGLAKESARDRGVPQANCFIFHPSQRILTYNSEICISVPFPKGLSVKGAVQGEPLLQLLDKLDDKDLDIIQTEAEVQFKAGRIKAGLPYQSSIEVPFPEETVEEEGWSPVVDDFMEALEFVMYSCGKDFSAPVHTCVHVNFQRSRVESTDNHRVTRFLFKKDKDSRLSFRVLIPATIVKDLVQFSKREQAGKGISHLKQGKDEAWLHFRSTEGEAIFSCRLFAEPSESPFPDIDKQGLFKPEKGVEIKLNPRLDQVLDRASIFTKRDYTLEEKIQATIIPGEREDRGRLRIRAEGPQGWFEEESNLSYKGKPRSFVVHPQFLKDMIAKPEHTVIVGDSRIHFEAEKWWHVATLTDPEQ